MSEKKIESNPAPANSASELAGEIVGKEQIYELLKTLGKRKTIFHRINDEIVVYEPVADLIDEAILCKEPVLQFTVPSRAPGKWLVDVYQFNSIFVVRWVWSPDPGYSWSEKKIEIIRVAGGEKDE